MATALKSRLAGSGQLFQQQLQQPVKPNGRIIGFLSPTKVRPRYKALRIGSSRVFPQAAEPVCILATTAGLSNVNDRDEKQMQILRLTTPKLKNVWGPFRPG